ncbi:MAG: ATP-dependent metallopeptidase FtsH/Yme1/Tma family protein [Deltaproteobacteria bacterium]|nr:MAG: ATP-dependent metallopeptidase FtsH/Yme1/Tma family protein [Deltaproteobacteria bacterium]
MKQSHRTLILWVVLILLLVFIYQLFSPRNPGKPISFTDFISKVKNHDVKEVTIQGQVYTGKLRDTTKFRTVGIKVNDKFNNFLVGNKVKVTYKRVQVNSFWQQLIISWLPFIFIIAITILFFRQLQAGSGKAMSFGKSRAKLLNDHHNKVTFNDVAGVEEAKEELEEIVQFLKDPKKFTRLGGRIPKGVLLMGSPGTGKTLLGRAVAGEAGVPFFSISGSDFVEMFVGVGASRVRDLFEQGKKNAPCIIFIDEIDAVGRHRGAGLGGGHDEREQTLNQLLVEMDGFESNEGVILVAATNRPDVLDPALLRPGRFDRRVVVPLPDLVGREKILEVHSRRTPLADDVDLHVIARGTPGFSGADVENLVNEAALTAARMNKNRLHMEHFEEAKDKVMMGRERRSMILNEEEKYRTAVHEVGHALVGKMLEHADPVHKVTVIPRGRALGVTMFLPNEDVRVQHKEAMEARIAVALGGRAADELIHGEKSSGASNDIKQATSYARKMVCEWGMSEKLGPLAYGEQEEQIFLGRELSRHRDYSESTAIAIDEEVRRIVQEAYDCAVKILSENRELVLKISDELTAREVLSSEELDMMIRGEELPPMKGAHPEKKSEKEEVSKAAEETEKTDAKEGSDSSASPEGKEEKKDKEEKKEEKKESFSSLSIDKDGSPSGGSEA